MMTIECMARSWPKAMHLLRFLLVGLPSFAIAVLLNWALVTQVGMARPLAYALVLVLQVSVNFFMCRAFVFNNHNDRPIWVQFGQFFSGIIAFRAADWLVYVIAVQFLGVHYLLMQFVDIAIFSLLKFEFSRRVIELH